MKGNGRWIIIAISLFVIASLARSVVDLWQRRSIVEQEKKRLSALEKKHEELTKKLEMVQTPMFIEKEARERLGMAKEGETIILMNNASRTESVEGSLPEQAQSHPIGMQSGESLQQIPYWKRWWMTFF